uniref:Uncharacterized protein n=1 Tax=Anopheles culicifacies TaxID=139723 RepID=A0A182MVQ3_9DIPT
MTDDGPGSTHAHSDTVKQVTVASSGDSGGAPAGEQSNALLSKLGSSLFGATGSPQKVVTNIRGFLSNRLTSVTIPDTDRFWAEHGYLYISSVQELPLVLFYFRTELIILIGSSVTATIRPETERYVTALTVSIDFSFYHVRERILQTSKHRRTFTAGVARSRSVPFLGSRSRHHGRDHPLAIGLNHPKTNPAPSSAGGSTKPTCNPNMGLILSKYFL